MNAKGIGQIRKENLQFLTDTVFGTQQILSLRINHSNLSQPTISDILRGKRSFHDSEVRYTEQKLSIPLGWMDLDSMLANGWAVITEYQKMPKSHKATFDKGTALLLRTK